MEHKRKITAEGQLCRHCNTPVVRKVHNPNKQQGKRSYYFEWWFRCPNCGVYYLVAEAKRYYSNSNRVGVSGAGADSAPRLF